MLRDLFVPVFLFVVFLSLLAALQVARSDHAAKVRELQALNAACVATAEQCDSVLTTCLGWQARVHMDLQAIEEACR